MTIARVLLFTAQSWLAASGESVACQAQGCDVDDVNLLQAGVSEHWPRHGHPYQGYEYEASHHESHGSADCEPCKLKKQVKQLQEQVRDLQNQVNTSQPPVPGTGLPTVDIHSLAYQLNALQGRFQKSQQEIKDLQDRLSGQPPSPTCSPQGNCSHGLNVKWNLMDMHPAYDKQRLIDEFYRLLFASGLEARCLQPLTISPHTYGDWGTIYAHVSFNSTMELAKAAAAFAHLITDKSMTLFVSASAACPDACAGGANYMKVTVTYPDLPECQGVVQAQGFGGDGYLVETLPIKGGRAGFAWMIPSEHAGKVAIDATNGLRDTALAHAAEYGKCDFKSSFDLNKACLSQPTP